LSEPATQQRLAYRGPEGETSIVVAPGALRRAAGLLQPWLAGRTVFVLSSPPIRALHGARLDAVAAPAARRVDLDVADGEAAKTLAEAERLWTAMLQAGGKRDSRLLAFGGGSVGDLGGFVAGCFLRGIEFAQLPTTLLAQVDAALGGKTAVDLPGGKNTVGLFHHPRAVVSDTEVLATLPRRELRSGLVECIKMAFILDAGLFVDLESRLDALLAGDATALTPVVARSAAAKVAVVESDDREAGRRRLLNLGHTLGHAIESALGYTGLAHGEAVAYGLLFVLRLAEGRGLDAAEPELFARLRRLLGRLGLPPLPADGLDADDLLDRLGRDKKARESGLVWVLPECVGGGAAEGRTVADVGGDEVRRTLETFLDEPLAGTAVSEPGSGGL
jgi:3-dehydroquinate synthase